MVLDVAAHGCTASADELAAIARALRAASSDEGTERERTADGLRLRVASDPHAQAALRDYVRREQQCCTFLEISLTEDDGGLSATVTGPPGTGPLLDRLYRLTDPVADPPG